MNEFNREDFERNFHILEEMVKERKFSMNSSISSDSILRVFKTPNGRIDFLTVDEMARNMVNTMGVVNAFNIKNLDDK